MINVPCHETEMGRGMEDRMSGGRLKERLLLFLSLLFAFHFRFRKSFFIHLVFWAFRHYLLSFDPSLLVIINDLHKRGFRVCDVLCGISCEPHPQMENE